MMMCKKGGRGGGSTYTSRRSLSSAHRHTRDFQAAIAIPGLALRGWVGGVVIWAWPLLSSTEKVVMVHKYCRNVHSGYGRVPPALLLEAFEECCPSF
jgi:hypothetical protein